MHRRFSLGLALVAALMSTPLMADPVGIGREVSQYIWAGDGAKFGGFSALEMDADGAGFTAISDHGAWLRGQITRGSGGQIMRIETEGVHDLHPRAGDSEGLAVAADGRYYVSFEGRHQVFAYDDLSGQAKALPAHKDFAGMIKNASLEALAIGPDGALYTLPERSGHKARPFPIYRFKNGAWSQPFDLPRVDEFQPVGADFGPDGKLYLLERRFSLIRGFTNRVRRFTVTEGDLQDAEMVFESQVGTYHNLEGISVWRTDSGNIWLTMIADDNFNFFQATEIVEYEIAE